MISWFTKDIAYFLGYAAVGVACLALLVRRPYFSRWGRFFVGLTSIAYGTIGLLNGGQLLRSIKTIIKAMPWSEVETSKLVYAAAGVEWASLVLQFAFAAVGGGLIVNAITAEKTMEKPIANPPPNTDAPPNGGAPVNIEAKPSVTEIDSAYIGQVLMAMAECMSSGLSKFSGWMLFGYAAILGALLANLDSAAKFIAPNTLSRLAALFSGAVLLNLLQRYSAAVVSSSAEVGKRVKEQPVPKNIDIVVFLTELEHATLWPARLMVRRSNRKLLAGDLAAGGRLLSTFAQIEAWLVFAQVLVSVAATLVLACGLRG